MNDPSESHYLKDDAYSVIRKLTEISLHGQMDLSLSLYFNLEGNSTLPQVIQLLIVFLLACLYRYMLKCQL